MNFNQLRNNEEYIYLELDQYADVFVYESAEIYLDPTNLYRIAVDGGSYGLETDAKTFSNGLDLLRLGLDEISVNAEETNEYQFRSSYVKFFSNGTDGLTKITFIQDLENQRYKLYRTTTVTEAHCQCIFGSSVDQ